MDDKQDKGNKLNQDLLYENKANSNKIYNYFYSLLNYKKYTKCENKNNKNKKYY